MEKVYTAAFKAQVALDLLKEEKTLAQISAEYGVHANVLRDWRTQALKGLPTIFDRRDDIAALKTTPAGQVVLDAVAFLRRIEGQRDPDMRQAPRDAIPRTWKKFVLLPRRELDRP